jgi:hypothetical protein
MLKYQATYEYSYRIDENAPGVNNTKELLPYMYDSREQKEANQYIECKGCGTNFPCYFDKWADGVTTKMIQEAIDSAYMSQQ